MQNSSNFVHSDRLGRQSLRQAPQRIAIDEAELSQRWGLSVKTLRRWRQEKLGPVFCKMGARVTYLLYEIEAYERRVSRHSTSVCVYQ
jgi:hypothetical protein